MVEARRSLVRRDAERRPPGHPPRHPGPLPPTLFLVALIAQLVGNVVLPLMRIVPWPWTLVGLAPLAGGIALVVLADRQFKRAGTPVHPHDAPAALVTRGAYAATRNPMYLGMVVMATGVALLLGTLTAFVVVPLLGWLLSIRFIRQEEDKLAKHYGESYRRYAQRVPRWLWPRGGVLAQVGWWILLVMCVLYGAFALVMGVHEVVAQLGLTEAAKHRAAPWVFVVHALSGGVALLAGPLQLSGGIRRRWTRLHRTIGRAYVLAVWIASVTALWVALSFDVSVVAKAVFAILAVLWCGTTTIGLRRVLERRVPEHREWMIRSFALTFFAVTFSFWVPGLASTALPSAIAYPLSVFASWILNLAVAEWWIRRTRSARAGSSPPRPVSVPRDGVVRSRPAAGEVERYLGDEGPGDARRMTPRMSEAQCQSGRLLPLH